MPNLVHIFVVTWADFCFTIIIGNFVLHVLELSITCSRASQKYRQGWGSAVVFAFYEYTYFSQNKNWKSFETFGCVLKTDSQSPLTLVDFCAPNFFFRPKTCKNAFRSKKKWQNWRKKNSMKKKLGKIFDQKKIFAYDVFLWKIEKETLLYLAFFYICLSFWVIEV